MSAHSETVAIPQSVRQAVDERDRGVCRFCGKFLGPRRAIHHIDYGGDTQGMGGRRNHEVSNLISLCWLPGDGDCHQRAHSDKAYWLPILTEVAIRAGNVTALQLSRWNQKEEAT